MRARQGNAAPVVGALWSAAWTYRRRAGAALLLLVLAKLAGVGVPLVLKAIVDRFSDPVRLSEPASIGGAATTLMVVPVFLLLGYALLRFASTLFTELRDRVFARVTHATVADYAARCFRQLMTLSPRFHAQRQTGSLLRDVERGTHGVGFLLGAGLFTMLPTLVEFAAVLAVMAWGYSLWFTLVIVATFCVYAASTVTLTQRRVVHQRRVNELDSRVGSHLVDSLINYEAIKAFAREDDEQLRHARLGAEGVESSVISQRALFALHVGQGAIIAAGVAAVMLLAGQQVARGAMTVGDLVLVNAYVIQICLPLNALGFVFREVKDALVNTETLFALLAERPDVQDRPGAQPLALRQAELNFEHVDFGYEPGRPILRDVNLRIAPGNTVAVVGGSGSGKSTLARLLLRLYDVNAGRVLVGGQDVREVRMGSLREAIGLVPQDTVLFNDTLAHNIGYGRAGAGITEVVEAARAAQLHEFILTLPQQYDTVVGERGLKLSGGERQRVGIARAFLKNPPIMVFDEATSALDTRAERAIQSELDRIAQGRTTLVIAHRLSTIVNADEIVVLDKGRIVECGRHDALLEHGGLYAQLWNLQLQQRDLERLERRLARQPVNLALLLGHVVDGLREGFEAHRVRVYSDLEIEDASVTGDPQALSQVLHELVAAALRSTPAGGRVGLRLERVGPALRFSVTDGRGAAQAPASGRAASGERVALRAPPPVTAVPPDPLALRSTIERQGGSLHVEPPSATQGMRYTVELPLRAVTSQPPRAPDAADKGSGTPTLPQDLLQGVRILCIDDDRDAREALGWLLEAYGAQALPLDSGQAAMAWLEARPSAEWPAVVVCDITLGDEDGYTVVRRLRQLEAARQVPLADRTPAIALTGHAHASDRVTSLMAGFQAHLAKPADPVELLTTLAALTGRRDLPTPGSRRP